jgi:hypothetical protein
MKERRPKLINLETKKGNIAIGTTEIQRNIRQYFEKFHFNKLESLKDFL